MPAGLDYDDTRRIREWLRAQLALNTAEPLTAQQVASEFRLPAEAEPEIQDIMTEVAVLHRHGSDDDSKTPAPARDLATLARDIRHAWLVTTAAIRFPAPAATWSLDDPEIASVVQARDQAFSWALDELVGGGYLAPQYQVTALENRVIPVPELVTDDIP